MAAVNLQPLWLDLPLLYPAWLEMVGARGFDSVTTQIHLLSRTRLCDLKGSHLARDSASYRKNTWFLPGQAKSDSGHIGSFSCQFRDV